tara:strand:- start:331 stop:705 length:375 start_codon:yes stop_codon:yes gene_type:complete
MVEVSNKSSIMASSSTSKTDVASETTAGTHSSIENVAYSQNDSTSPSIGVDVESNDTSSTPTTITESNEAEGKFTGSSSSKEVELTRTRVNAPFLQRGGASVRAPEEVASNAPLMQRRTNTDAQ